jgi:ATP-binding cassette subfamily B protein
VEVGLLVRLLREYLQPYRRTIWILIGLQFVGTLANLYLPALNADIIDKGVVRSDTGYIWRIGGLMLLISAVQLCSSVGAVFFGARTAMSVGNDLRAGLFRRVQDFSTREVGKFGTPSLITRSTNDVQQVQMLVLMTFTLMVSAPIMCIGGIIMAIRQDLPLSSLLLFTVPVLAISLLTIVSKLRPQFRLMQVKIDRINQVVREQIQGVRVVRAFVREDAEQSRFEVANGELLEVSLKVGRLMAFMFPLVLLVANVSSVGVLWFGGHRIDSGGMQVGALTAFLSYLMQILIAVMMATFMFMMVPRAEVCADRIAEVFDTEPSVAPPLAPVALATLHGHLELRGASFGYPGAEHDVIDNVSFTAGPGQVTAIIGSTGSGKTTLLNLIPRLMDTTSGQVLVDGVDVRDLDPAVLAQAVGFVPQRPYLFSGTIASNLRYGRPDATDEELWHALDVAQARSFVEAMPDGLETSIAQGGTNVSGGQRQRLAIARALVRRPEIYLFDDSFSALDYVTDAALRAALPAETSDATVVIVAQRVSTIRHADQIIVLENGRVVGIGTHQELMDTNETYQEIVLSQLTAEEAA